MKNLIKLALIVCFLNAGVCTGEEAIPKAFIADDAGEIVYLDKKTSEPRSRISFSIKQTSKDGHKRYEYTSHGKGDYGKYKNVTWDITAEIEAKDDFLYPLYSRRIIKNEKSDIIVEQKKRFDYSRRKIYATVSDGSGRVLKSKIFPIKGRTIDSAAMGYFLRTFAAHRNDKAYNSFYVVSNDANLYRLNIKNMGPEVVETPLGKIETIKLKLTPDLGLLTAIAGFIAPETFVWLERQTPHAWIKYDGLETNLGSKHITAIISAKEPSPK